MVSVNAIFTQTLYHGPPPLSRAAGGKFPEILGILPKVFRLILSCSPIPPAAAREMLWNLSIVTGADFQYNRSRARAIALERIVFPQSSPSGIGPLQSGRLCSARSPPAGPRRRQKSLSEIVQDCLLLFPRSGPYNKADCVWEVRYVCVVWKRSNQRRGDPCLLLPFPFLPVIFHRLFFCPSGRDRSVPSEDAKDRKNATGKRGRNNE